MAQFLDARDDIVQTAVDGLVAASGGRLARLDGYPFIKVVLRADWDRARVALISGGGAGHEPAHAGFVGAGMLTAAVCGDVFASPSVEAVLAGILAVTGDAGAVVIVKNYTGDRLNFGLAVARARAMGLRVNMVFVRDDIALPDLASPRGVAGTLFVHKIAGAVAEAGGDLDAVTAAAARAAAGAMSIGMSLDTCTVPGSAKEARIAAGQIELGLGIHGEPGVMLLPYRGARGAMDDLVARLEPRMTAPAYVALINNLGGTTELEMAVLTDALRQSVVGGRISHVVGPGSMMTSLDMHGVSVSVLPLTEEDRLLLDASVGPAAWPGLRGLAAPRIVALPEGLQPWQPVASANAGVAALLTGACRALIAAEADLNALDARSGDGDTGSTLATAARALMAAIPRLPLDHQGQLLRAIGQELGQSMGGSSGVLLAIFFTAAGEAGGDLGAALQAGLARLQEVGGAAPGDRTLVDALLPALQALPQGMAAAAQAARAGADATTTMGRAQAGRASYVGADHLLGHADPGAEAVARLFAHLAG